MRTEDLLCAFKILLAHARKKPGGNFLSTWCTKTSKSACVMRTIFCRQNVLSCAFYKLSSLAINMSCVQSMRNWLLVPLFSAPLVAVYMWPILTGCAASIVTSFRSNFTFMQTGLALVCNFGRNRFPG